MRIEGALGWKMLSQPCLLTIKITSPTRSRVRPGEVARLCATAASFPFYHFLIPLLRVDADQGRTWEGIFLPNLVATQPFVRIIVYADTYTHEARFSLPVRRRIFLPSLVEIQSFVFCNPQTNTQQKVRVKMCTLTIASEASRSSLSHGT